MYSGICFAEKFGAAGLCSSAVSAAPLMDASLAALFVSVLVCDIKYAEFWYIPARHYKSSSGTVWGMAMRSAKIPKAKALSVWLLKPDS